MCEIERIWDIALDARRARGVGKRLCVSLIEASLVATGKGLERVQTNVAV